MATENKKMQQRRDTAANWTTNNPTLSAGEIGFETNTGKFKIGDGATAWNSLAYATAPFTAASASAAASLAFAEDTDNGTNKVTITAPAAIASDKTATLQDRTGTVALTDGYGMPCEIGVAVSDETTALTTGAGKVVFYMPYAMTVTDVRASVTTAPTGAAILVDIHEGAGAGTTILSTKINIDATEFSSEDSGTPPVISDTALADNARINIDIDQVGSTIAGAGLKVWIIGTRA